MKRLFREYVQPDYFMLCLRFKNCSSIYYPRHYINLNLNHIFVFWHISKRFISNFAEFLVRFWGDSMRVKFQLFGCLLCCYPGIITVIHRYTRAHWRTPGFGSYSLFSLFHHTLKQWSLTIVCSILIVFITDMSV